MIDNIQDRLLFIVGLQKSGTTLLNRLLTDQPNTIDPFKPEGRYFWGDYPPFSPTLAPCGQLYQAHGGRNGHHLSDIDFKLKDKAILLKKISEISLNYKVLINKNPYNTVRIKWLKSVFPNSRIIAIIRNPISNVFSLNKKFINHKHMGLPPENGWWGVKPKNWKSLICNDLIEQLSNQWIHVNRELVNNADLLNGLIDYHDVCNNTSAIIKKILSPYDIQTKNKKYKIVHQDFEFKVGSRLLSKNKEYKNHGFQLKLTDESVEFPPFSASQINQINNQCGSLWSQIQSKLFLSV